jgi:hypothetical protein
MADTGAPVLDADNAAFIMSGVSIAVASSRGDGLPTIVRAWGCRVAADLCEVTVFVSPAQGDPVLACLRDGRPLAAVFSLPSSHRTIQLKSPVTDIAPCTRDDRPAIERYIRDFAADLMSIGHDESFTSAYLEFASRDLVRVTFRPAEAFVQTPGPRAGERLPLTAA